VRTYIFFGCHKSPRASKSPKKQKAACWPSAARSLRVKRSAQKALKASKEKHSLTRLIESLDAECISTMATGQSPVLIGALLANQASHTMALLHP